MAVEVPGNEKLTQLAQVVLALIDRTEALEKRLRLYEGTLRFVRANNAKVASDFEADMAVVSMTPGLLGECVSPEIDGLGEQVRQLVAQIALELGKHSKL
jgi:hypothetical protein